MKTTTRQPTLKQLQAAARKRWGKEGFAEYRPDGPTPDERAESQDEAAVRKARMDEIKSDADNRSHWKALLAAAQFVRDVNGDPPSIERLGNAVAMSERFEAARIEYKDLYQEQQSTTHKRYGYRWRAGEVSSMFVHVRFQADSAAELLDKIVGAE